MSRASRLLAICVGLVLLWFPAPVAPESETTNRNSSTPGVQIVDLALMLTEIERGNQGQADLSQSFYRSPAGSVHVHVLGYEQLTPLHIHRATEEATVILTGAPQVTLAFARNGKIKSTEQTAEPGTLIYSPPFAGHEWFNTNPRAMQANLVFASPPFDGNFYLKASDKRLLKSGEPRIFNPDAALRSFLAAGRPNSIEALPMQRDKMAMVLIRSEGEVAEHPSSPTLIYVSRGAGSLFLDKEYPIRKQTLIMVPPNMRIRIRAGSGSPIVAVAFRPEA